MVLRATTRVAPVDIQGKIDGAAGEKNSLSDPCQHWGLGSE